MSCFLMRGSKKNLKGCLQFLSPWLVVSGFVTSLVFTSIVRTAEWVHRAEGDVSRCGVHESGQCASWRAAVSLPGCGTGRQHCQNHLPGPLSECHPPLQESSCWNLSTWPTPDGCLWDQLCWTWTLLLLDIIVTHVRRLLQCFKNANLRLLTTSLNPL